MLLSLVDVSVSSSSRELKRSGIDVADGKVSKLFLTIAEAGKATYR